MQPQQLHVNTILLADDDEDDRILFRDALYEVRADMELSEVENGSELMHRLEDSQAAVPDVLFLDLNMPLKNGYECISEIRSHENLQQLPIVVLSTSSMDESIEKMMYQYSCSYIKKPGTYLELKAALRSAIDNQAKPAARR